MDKSPDRTQAVAFDASLSRISAEDRCRILMDACFDWDYWQLPDGSFEYVSPSCHRITGYTADEFMRNPDLYYQIIHPDDRRLVRAHHCRSGSGAGTSLEFRIVRKDGRERWIDHLCRKIQDAQSGFLGCRASNRDITARKRAELRFREKSAQIEENSYLLKSIIEFAPIGIAVADAPQIKIRLISNRGCELEGRSREELEKFSAEQYQFIHPDGTLADTEQVPLARAVMYGEHVADEEWTVVHPDGIRVETLCNAGPIYNAAGTIIGGVMIWQDITGRKRNEQFLQQSRRKLLDLKEQLESKNKEMESIIGTVSHDLRSPLVSIQGFSKEIQLSIETVQRLLRQAHLSEPPAAQIDSIFSRDISEFLTFIKTSASAMDRLVKSLVKVARIGMAELNPEEIDMDELVSNVTGAMGFAIKQAGVNLDVQPLPDCFADIQQITQVFANLLDNAIKYRQPDRLGRIRVHGETEGDCSVYIVQDNGIGIAPEYQEKVFNLFDRISQQPGGEGIGLAMVKRMVERNGGCVHLSSIPGQGTVFKIYLPASKPREEAI
ncbi:MAG: PAS domain S-box protein [Planctomycetaceae bacterium]|nr:PAS domain S-box protein [Planctomycetaceae bacterium]